MSKFIQFGFGGLGGLLPLVATLVAIDLSAIASLVDNNSLTLGLCVGYTIKVLGLFSLGGIMAALNNEIRSPLALVQIGIAAPALITSYMSGAAIIKSQDPPSSINSSLLFSSAYAGQTHSTGNVILAEGFLKDVIQGIQPGLGVEMNQMKQVVIPPPNITQNSPFRVTNPSTNFCLTVPPGQVSSADQYGELAKSFPQPNFIIEPGTCGP